MSKDAVFETGVEAEFGAGVDGLHIRSSSSRAFVKRYDTSIDSVVTLGSFETIDEAASYAKSVLLAELDEAVSALKRHVQEAAA